MGDVCHKVSHRLLTSLNLLDHLVEGSCQAVSLIRAGGSQPLVIVAGRHRTGGFRGFLQWSRDPARDQPGENEGRRQRYERRAQDERQQELLTDGRHRIGPGCE